MSSIGAAGHVALRLALAYLCGGTLDKRVELNSPIYSLISIREATFWSNIGRSPYTASLVRTPPLLLLALEQLASHRLLLTGVLSTIDCVTSRLLSALSARELTKEHDPGSVLCPVSLSCSRWSKSRIHTVFCSCKGVDPDSSFTIPAQPFPCFEYLSSFRSIC